MTTQHTYRGHLPPAYRWELEECVLGSILLETDAMALVYDHLTPQNFVGIGIRQDNGRTQCDYQGRFRTVEQAIQSHTVPHAWIYQTMQEMYEASEKLNIVTVGQRMRQKWGVKCHYQVSALTDRIASSSQLPQFATKLITDSLAYTLVSILQNAMQHQRQNPDGADNYTQLETMVRHVQSGSDPIDMAISCHSYCQQYGMPTVANQLAQYAERAESRWKQLRTRTRSTNLVERLAETLTGNVTNQQAIMVLKQLADHLATKQGNANTDLIEKLYQLKALIK